MSDTTFTNRIMKRIGFVPTDSSGGIDGLYPSPFTAEQDVRRELMGLYWDYYEGKQRPPLKTPTGQPDLNTIENFSSLIVNMSNQFLFGGGIKLELDDDEQSESDNEKAINELFDGLLYASLGQSGSVTGTPILRVFPQGDELPPRVVVVDPAGVEVFTNSDDLSDVTEYRQTWRSGDKWERQRITKEDGTWYIIAETRSKGGDWVRDEEQSEMWPYATAPMFVGQNIPRAFKKYGLSDLTNGNLQDAINRTSSDIGKIIFHHAAPKTIWTGGQGRKIELQSTGGATIIPIGKSDELHNLEMQSDLTASGERRESLIGSLLSSSFTPDMSAENVQLGAVSGFALQLSMMPALGKMNMKRLTYEKIIKGAAALCLEIMGVDDVTVKINWGDPLPKDEDAMAARYVALMGTNTDSYNAAIVAGYPAEDAERLAARRLIIPSSPLDEVVNG